MKLLHTSDWHLGMTFRGGVSYAADQRYVIGRICSIAEKEKADGILLAGDVSDKSIASPEAIDEGFGSLDDESIGDAMNVLNSIQKANGLVDIISHVQILQEQIPVKLKVEKDSRGSHIVQTIG